MSEAEYLDDAGEYYAYRDFVDRQRSSKSIRSKRKMSETYEVSKFNESSYVIMKNDRAAYKVDVDQDNNLSCNCPGFTYRGMCKHTQMVRDKFNIGDPKVKRIPRAEINKIKKELTPLFDHFSAKWDIVGSYRRGKPDSKDIDIIILIPEVDKWEDFVDKVEMLPSYVRTVRGDVITRGTFKGYPLDINRVQLESEWIPQLLYRTGSAEHNIRMRGIAKRNGWTLNEHGLFDDEGKLMSGDWTTEEEYFTALDIRYRNPEDR